MATVSKLLIRLQKFSSKISKVVDATDSFSANNNYYQDLSGWDSAVVQVVGLTGSIDFSTTNDDGAITGQLLPAPEVPINWVSVLGVDLVTKTDVSSVSADGIVEFGIIGKYLLLQGSVVTTSTTTSSSYTIDILYGSAPGPACAGTSGVAYSSVQESSITTGTTLYSDSGLTTTITYPYVKVLNNIYSVTSGVLSLVGSC